MGDDRNIESAKNVFAESAPAECADREASHKRTGGGTLDRYINLLSATNFGFILLCSWEFVSVVFQFSLLNGGPASMIYGSIFSGIGSTFIAMSLAEMASIDPTVGAQYRWSANFAPKWNKFWGLTQGWLTVFAWMCASASIPATLANIVVSLLIFNYENYVPKRWHATLLMWAFTIPAFAGNFWFRRLLNVLQTVGCLCHVFFFIISVATLAVMAPRSSVEFVFTSLTYNVSGWTNAGVAWGIGLLTVTSSLSGFDGVLHMSDEVKKARTRVPRSIIASCVLNSVLQFAYIITLLFTLGDIDKVTSTPTGLPLIEVYYQATKSKHATNVFVAMAAIVIYTALFNDLASVSRLIWAFSRDNGLPFSNFFAYVHPTFKLPVNALGLVGVFITLIAIIYIGSTTAFNAIISLTALALYISYFLPILFFLLKRISKNPPEYGPFRLGKFGVALNLYALCYILFIVIWMPFPTMLPVTAVNFNYAGPLVGAVIIGALLDWCISGRKRFEVPVPRHKPDL
ncbi:amino acid transporter [Zopfia rhizophila CBS 207.26]|uniref:Amino acid transporter n=1 Tax=Zopfia rhizophila CBS 207.26 TaxID=1314779 RepID=A0A6A6EEW3_9PEZI|nr:amino acid transporter [Zopfia rhizophila CBS 207.26]